MLSPSELREYAECRRTQKWRRKSHFAGIDFVAELCEQVAELREWRAADRRYVQIDEFGHVSSVLSPQPRILKASEVTEPGHYFNDCQTDGCGRNWQPVQILTDMTVVDYCDNDQYPTRSLTSDEYRNNDFYGPIPLPE